MSTVPKPTPEALANIPIETIRNWPRSNIAPGTIIARHLLGCRTQGGVVSPSRCPRCNRHVEWKYRSGLAFLDSRAGGR